ncbi:hypothetical protein G6F22_013645 [Rhizopus arrhizus]|nr:hypothetical protein G6F22_013645 [Rhizopus arrhizus]
MFRVARADARRRLKRGGPVQALRLTVWLALCVLAMVLPLAASAQPAATTPAPAAPVASAEAPAPRIGVVTMQPGTVFFERFGHDAIVVIDPASGEATSYNFGYFDPSEDDFISRFMRGDMMYYLVALPLQQDLSYYDETGRGASVQWLDLRPDQARALAAALAERAKPENARYHYDYYTANCATMVRDTVDKALGGGLQSQLVDVAGLRRRPRPVRRPAAVALAGSVRTHASGRCAAPGTQQRWTTAGAVRTGTVAAPHRPGTEGIRAPLVAVAAVRPGDRRRRAGAAQPPAAAGRAGPAVLAAVYHRRQPAGVPVGLQHPLRRLGQP